MTNNSSHYNKEFSQSNINELNYIENSKLSLKTLVILLVLIIILTTIIYLIRICVSERKNIMQKILMEANLLQVAAEDYFSYSKYFLNLIKYRIEHDPYNLFYINKIFIDYFSLKNLNSGWEKYSWVNNNYYEVVTSVAGTKSVPQYMDFIKEIVKNINTSDPISDNIDFYIKKSSDKIKKSLKLIDSIIDKKTNKYIGSVVLSYNLDIIANLIEKRKGNPYTSFLIIDYNRNVLLKSQMSINGIVDQNNYFNKKFNRVLEKLNFNQDHFSNIFFLDMISGMNYIIHGVKGSPFFIIVNIDNISIKNKILENVIKKSIEVCFFSAISLYCLFAIYRREVVLRDKVTNLNKIVIDGHKARINLLSYTAHEIRSVLGFILTGSEVMIKGLLGKMPKEYLTYAEGIHKNSTIISDFITEILDDNQILEGKFKIRWSLLSIEEVINESIKYNISTYNNYNLKIDTEYQDKLPFIICDKRRMLQVMNNLLSNSIKYSKENTLIVVKVAYKKDHLAIQVIDQGIGMNKNDIPIALSAYGTLHKSRYSNIISCGLGLPIVKMLVEAQGAKFIISSVENKGTTVTIIFPKHKLVNIK